MKRIAGTPLKPPPSARTLEHVAGFERAAEETTAIVSRLRKGREILSQLGPDSPGRPRAAELWASLVMSLYIALRDAYGRFALLRQMGDEVEAISTWNRLMPNTDDFGKLGVRALFDYYRGRLDPPIWITNNECRLVGNLLWPPRPGEDVFDSGVADMLEEVPFD